MWFYVRTHDMLALDTVALSLTGHGDPCPAPYAQLWHCVQGYKHTCEYHHLAGEVATPALQDKIRDAALHKRVPALLALRKDVRHILRSSNSTIAALCSPSGSVDPDVAAAKDSVRKKVMKNTLEVSISDEWLIFARCCALAIWKGT